MISYVPSSKPCAMGSCSISKTLNSSLSRYALYLSDAASKKVGEISV